MREVPAVLAVSVYKDAATYTADLLRHYYIHPGNCTMNTL